MQLPAEDTGTQPCSTGAVWYSINTPSVGQNHMAAERTLAHVPECASLACPFTPKTQEYRSEERGNALHSFAATSLASTSEN